MRLFQPDFAGWLALKWFIGCAGHNRLDAISPFHGVHYFHYLLAFTALKAHASHFAIVANENRSLPTDAGDLTPFLRQRSQRFSFRNDRPALADISRVLADAPGIC
jgi:hypothetical protein